jgi:hypothetical protein
MSATRSAGAPREDLFDQLVFNTPFQPHPVCFEFYTSHSLGATQKQILYLYSSTYCYLSSRFPFVSLHVNISNYTLTLIQRSNTGDGGNMGMPCRSGRETFKLWLDTCC